MTVTLYNDDCLNVMRGMGAGSVDAVITDPPYGIDYQSNMRVVSKKFDKISWDNNDKRFETYPIIEKILKNNTIFGCFASYKNYADDYQIINSLFSIKNVIVWDKGGGGIGDLTHSLLTDYELMIIAHKGACEIRGKRCGSVWRFSKVTPSVMVHPTEKPVALMKKIILKWTYPGDTILDPFMGSGTTGVACVQTDRHFIGIEKDPDYFAIAERRIKEAQQQPTLWSANDTD